LFEESTGIIISAITKLEIVSTIKRLLTDKAITEQESIRLKGEIFHDFTFYKIVQFNKAIEDAAIHLIEKHNLRALDSIQLASCLNQKKVTISFIVSDKKLKAAAFAEGIKVIDPLGE
jgi:predicted nucleic acid-binding protein